MLQVEENIFFGWTPTFLGMSICTARFGWAKSPFFVKPFWRWSWDGHGFGCRCQQVSLGMVTARWSELPSMKRWGKWGRVGAFLIFLCGREGVGGFLVFCVFFFWGGGLLGWFLRFLKWRSLLGCFFYWFWWEKWVRELLTFGVFFFWERRVGDLEWRILIFGDFLLDSLPTHPNNPSKPPLFSAFVAFLSRCDCEDLIFAEEDDTWQDAWPRRFHWEFVF